MLLFFCALAPSCINFYQFRSKVAFRWLCKLITYVVEWALRRQWFNDLAFTLYGSFDLAMKRHFAIAWLQIQTKRELIRIIPSSSIWLLKFGNSEWSQNNARLELCYCLASLKDISILNTVILNLVFIHHFLFKTRLRLKITPCLKITNKAGLNMVMIPKHLEIC